MRIRKHAAKLLLGLGVSHHSPPPSPLPAADVVAAEELFLCQLNSSPWDVTDPNLYFFDSQEEEGEKKRGNTGNGFGFRGDQEEHVMGISEPITRNVAIAKPNDYGSGEDADLNKVRKRRRTKKMEDDRKKRTIITDTANGGSDSHPSQVKNQQKPDASQFKNRMTKTTTITTDVAAASESVGNGSYFYLGLRSWRGKNRSNRKTAKVKELVEEGSKKSDSGEGSDTPVAGDDPDDMSDDDDNLDGDILGNNKGKIGWKRRGRKPIKTRSLKSL